MSEGLIASLLENESAIRLGSFSGIVFLIAVLEVLAPRRSLSISRSTRWPGNLGITFLNTFIVRIVATSGAVGFAIFAAENGLGLFNVFFTENHSFLILASVVLLDLSIYFQHWISHRIPFLWRFHKMHHADSEIDLTTGSRFHPVEILLSLGYKFLIISLLGASPIAVLIFEVILSSMAIFNHGNFRIPISLDRLLRLMIVTPDMHRVHHSVRPNEHHANFGFNLSVWDRIFKTYVSAPKDSHDKMKIGLKEFPEVSRSTKLWPMLRLPFD